MMFNKLNLITGGFMALIYAIGGILLLVLNTPYLRLPESYKTILGSAMIVYAGFRLFRLYKSYIATEKENENEERNI